MTNPANKRKRLIAAVIATGVVALLCAAFAIYAGSYSRADATAEAALAHASVSDARQVAFGDLSSDTALILYPGGKVAFTAYAPIAQRIADAADILVIVPEMPLNLAVFDFSAAAGIMKDAAYAGVENWFVGGHSLGGAMAAAFAAEEDVSGVVLLAAYATKPLSCPVLSVYGSLDTVLDRDKVEQYRGNLPADTAEVVLEGGNHAGFGSYGAQKGDTAATITAEEQWDLTAQAVADWLEKEGA